VWVWGFVGGGLWIRSDEFACRDMERSGNCCSAMLWSVVNVRARPMHKEEVYLSMRRRG